MADTNSLKSSEVDSEKIAVYIDSLVNAAKTSRRSFERKWYDNNFFDDGYHYRYVQRTTNHIVDLSEKASLYNPMRAIPKASRQIRGIANLLMSSQPTPVVLPEKVSKEAFPDQQVIDPSTGQPINIPNPLYEQTKQLCKQIAKRSGVWLEKEFEKQEMQEKFALMLILAAKHGVSYMQVWPDAIKEKIKTQVFDAFDIYLIGSLTDIYDSPFITKATPRFIDEIKADENFDPEEVKKLSPDNKKASSEVKDAYMKSRYGTETPPTVIQKETFLKEYLNEENVYRIQMQDDADEILEGKNYGDQVIRQTFTAGGITLRDRYVALPEYPFVDFRFEPGPIYQVPYIERFIPQNKSLDMITSRVEKYMHTAPMGIFMKRKGESFQITNQSGAQVVEYEATPPEQQTMAPLPGFIFNFIEYLGSLIEEQGVTTTTLGKIPQGVKAFSAIESLKESEYANLVIANGRFKNMVKRISERFLDLADRYFIEPQQVEYLDKGEPSYFDVIGSSALQQRQQLGLSTPRGVIPLSRDYCVEVEVQDGRNFTSEGKRAKAAEVMNMLGPYIQSGMVPPEAFKELLQATLETYSFGPVSDIMDAMQNTQGSFDDQSIQRLKIAMAEVIKDLDLAGEGAQEQRIMENKIGAVEALKDTGLVDRSGQGEEMPKPPSVSVSFKDLPPEGKAQAAANAGIQITPEQIIRDEISKIIPKAGSNK